MKKSTKLLFVLVFLSSSFSFAVYSTEEDINEWRKSAAKYTGELSDLSDASKTAIVTGNLDFAIKPYLEAYNGPLRDELGLSSIYQIFLIYIDPINVNFDNAKIYLEILEKEWSGEEETIKANQIYQKYLKKRKSRVVD